MQAVLIPFLLAANVSLPDDATWEHGALSKWKVDVNMGGKITLGPPSSMNGTIAFECTTKPDATTVFCKRTDVDLDFVEGNPTPTKLKGGGKSLPVEIKFNERGVEQISVPRDTRIPDIMFIKKIAYLFHIGVDLKEKKDQLPSFQATMQGLYRDCSANYSLAEYEIATLLPPDGSMVEKNYEVFAIPLPEQNRAGGIVTAINKNVDVPNCANSGMQFLEFISTDGTAANSKLDDITFRFGDDGLFEVYSSKNAHYRIKTEEREWESALHETLHIMLEDIKAAAESPPEIEDPKTFSLLFSDIGEEKKK